MGYFKAKKGCWDIIKRFYPVYENKQLVIEEMIRKYLKNDMILLDAGCGRGAESMISYTDEVKMSVGIDLSEAIKFNDTIHYGVISDVCFMGLANSSFDMVVSQELVEHVKRPDLFFSEVARVLRPGGVFILSTPNLLSWKTMIARITPYSFHKKMNRQLHGIDPKDVFPTFFRMNRYSKIESFFKKHDMFLENLVMWEGTPRTLTFNQITVYADICLVTILRKLELFKNFRELIVACFRKQSY